MILSTKRRLTMFERAALEARVDHITTLIDHLGKVDINCGQDFRMLLNVAVNSGIRQCEIAQHIKARRSKLSCWTSGASVARSRKERQRIADAIQSLLEGKLKQAKELIADCKPEVRERAVSRSHPDLIL